MELTLIQKITVWAIPLIFAITLHEVAHGWVANLCGDQTAKLSGRLTINPLKHIDLMGTVVIPIVLLSLGGFVFGWAKPVPVNASNVRYPRYQMPLISIAGPMSNFLMALLWAAIAKSGDLLAVNYPWFGTPISLMGNAGVTINVVLGVLNCLPIPPLDGWHFLLYAVSGRASYHLMKLEYYGFFILVALLATGILSYILMPPVIWMINAIAYLFGI